MASVALAIEKASSKAVSGELWWESHTQLFYALDKCGSAQRLRAHHQWLLNTVSGFKAPNSTSKAALSASQIDIGSTHSLEVKPALRQLAEQVSKHLVLDEVQAYILLDRFLEPSDAIPSTEDRSFLQSITMTYYMERQCLLKCLRLLLTFQSKSKLFPFAPVSEEGEIMIAHQAMSEEVKQLLKDGLENATYASLKERLAAATQPEHLDREYTGFWAEETALEQTLLLEILFLLYYEPLHSCKAARLKELLQTFQATVFRSSYEERLSITPESARCVVHVRQQAMLILIEALDLENLLLMVHDETPFSLGGHAFSVTEVQELDMLIGVLDPAEALEYAPLLLGWSTFLCLASFLPSQNGQLPLQDLDHTVYARQAYQGGAYTYLLEMLKSESFQEPDVQVGGYKSVVKTLTAAFLAAYDSASQTEFDMHDIIINIFCEIYRGQESLCLELWDRESVIDGPIRNLLFSLRENFPYQTLSFVRLMAALCKGAWPAECVYDFLYKMVKITSFYQHPENSVMHGQDDIVQTTVALQVPDAPGLFIPPGTYGRILRVVDGRVSLVHWECEHCGIVVLLLRMLQQSASKYQLEEVDASLDLLQQMLSANKVLAQLLLDLDEAVATVTARSDGRMESSLSVDVVGMICAIINGLVQNSNTDVMLASCLHILGSFALCSPQQVILELSRTSLFQPISSSLGGDGDLFGGSYLQALLLKTEQSSGDYPLIVAVLDLTKILVEKGVDSEVLSSLVMYVVRDLLVNHGNWKYQQPHQRWQITTEALQVALMTITRTSSKSLFGNLRRVLLEAFLFDSIIQDVLLQVLSIDAPTLEELHFSRVRSRELEWVQQALEKVLLLLHHVLLDATMGLASKNYPSTSLLEQSLFRKFVGPLSVIAVIASFLSFSRNVDLQLASAKMLTSLCISAQKARPHPISIASYVTFPEQRKVICTAVSQLLSEEYWLFNNAVFCAVIDLITAAVKFQPVLVELLLWPTASSQALVVDTTRATAAEQPSTFSSGDKEASSEVLEALWNILCKSGDLVNSHPHILSRVLFLLASLWQGGIEYLRVIEAFSTRPNFWKTLTLSLSFSSSSQSTSSSPPPTLGVSVTDFTKQELLDHAFKFRCEASVLSIMACDIFLQQYLLYPVSSSDTPATVLSNGASNNATGGGNNNTMTATTNGQAVPGVAAKPVVSNESGALEMVSEWARASAISCILKSYAFCLYDKAVLFRAQAEARLLVVGVMGKILNSDSRGVSATLLERVKEATTQLLEFPPFEELLGQYSSRGYSYGKSLQIMLLSDLYQHLLGELEGGRQVPSGSFQEVATYLLNKEMDILLDQNKKPSSLGDGFHPSYGNGFVYDTDELERELGIDWWPHTVFTSLPAATVESAVHSMQQANAMASLGHAQLSSLRAWSTLLTVSIFNKQGVTDLQWRDEDVDQAIEELCKALEALVMSTGLFGDVSNLMASFMSMQAHLLLILVRWFFNRAAAVASTAQRPSSWAVCAQIVRTTTGCLRTHLDLQGQGVNPMQQGELLVKGLMGALLVALELMYSQNGSKFELSAGPNGGYGQAMADAFADVTLAGLGFLPLLCSAVEHPAYANLALGAINLLINSFLAPSTWLALLQNYFPTLSVLRWMHTDSTSEYPKVVLSICLSLARVRGGAEMLQNAGFFSHLLILSQHFQDENRVIAGSMEGPFSVWQNWEQQQQEGWLWGLKMAVVTAILQSCGENDAGGAIVESALTYIGAVKERILSSLHAPVVSFDAQGRKKKKLQQPQTTPRALQETQHVVALLCELTCHRKSWVQALPNSVTEFCETSLHLLAYIAREGLVRPGVFHATHVGIRCRPVRKEEIAAHQRPSIVGSNSGWFAVCGMGSSVGEEKRDLVSTPLLSTSSPPSRTTSQSTGIHAIGSSFCTEYSDLVAINVYKLVLLLLKFICKQVQHAVERFEDGGPVDYTQFPELPSPEVLHSLQDQVVAVTTEVLSTRRPGQPKDRVVQDVCLLLLSILEKALYLEVCMCRTCGLAPHPLRVDDFTKEYRALQSAAQGHQFLDGPLRFLERILVLAYPEVI
ncbi:unnamed protein product [Sphagnum compactum]